jgi:hypothetical protein
MSCPVCYTDDADMVVCWNEHGLCETCYRECLKPRVRNDEIAGVDKYHVNDKCPTCREPMFDWFDLVVENMNDTMIAPVRQRSQRRGHMQLGNIDTRIIRLDRLITILTDLQANVRYPLPQPPPQPQPVRQHRTCRCGICGNTGHNRRTCPNRT